MKENGKKVENMINKKEITLDKLPEVLSDIMAEIELLKMSREPNRLMNINDAANYIGASRGEFVKYRKVKAIMPAKVPGSPRFLKSELDRFMVECQG